MKKLLYLACLVVLPTLAQVEALSSKRIALENRAQHYDIAFGANTPIYTTFGPKMTGSAEFMIYLDPLNKKREYLTLHLKVYKKNNNNGDGDKKAKLIERKSIRIYARRDVLEKIDSIYVDYNKYMNNGNNAGDFKISIRPKGIAKDLEFQELISSKF